MTRFRHGLVVGKFYPPHAGHHLLIDAAADACERVTVVVAASSLESIPVADRVAWLRATHAGRPHVRFVDAADDHPIDYGDPAVWDLHMTVFEAAVARAAVLDGLDTDAAAVDAVFSGEPYGDELARRLGATHVLVDRGTTGTSGTAVRADVPRQWRNLAPATRAGLALRVVVVGAESTGTTTVSRALAEAMWSWGDPWAATQWVPEFGRDYTIARLDIAATQAAAAGRPRPGMDDLVWTPEDFVEIARRQLALEDEAAATGGPVLVCDTDAFATSIWHERYLGTRHPEVEAIGDSRRHDLYLLTDHDGVPFEQDGIRDGEHVRVWMTERFAERLDETGRRWIRLTGPLDQRVAAALAAIDELVATGWAFADPSGRPPKPRPRRRGDDLICPPLPNTRRDTNPVKAMLSDLYEGKVAWEDVLAWASTFEWTGNGSHNRNGYEYDEEGDRGTVFELDSCRSCRWITEAQWIELRRAVDAQLGIRSVRDA